MAPWPDTDQTGGVDRTDPASSPPVLAPLWPRRTGAATIPTPATRDDPASAPETGFEPAPPSATPPPATAEPKALHDPGPAYRSVLPAGLPAPRQVAKRDLQNDVTEVPVPGSLVTAFQRNWNVDVSPVRLRRGHWASERAAALGARAFTQGGVVHLPDGAGPLDQEPARALLAHELTHAVQQEALGAALPPEDSATGRDLEATADAVERLFLGDGGAPPALVHARPALIAASPSPGPDQTAPVMPQRADQTVPDPPQQPEPEPAPETGAPMSWTPETGFVGQHTPAPPPGTDQWPGPPARPPAAGQTDPEPAALATVFQELSTLRTSVAELTEFRREQADSDIDLDDARTLERLAGRLYRHLRSRLRAELIIDRERSGLLADAW